MRYRARKVIIDGFEFDSAHEAQVCSELMLQQKAGFITQLQFHPTFTFIVNGVKIGKYTPDATFIDADSKLRVIDAKGFKRSPRTGKMLPRCDREFGLKKRLMLALFGLDVEIR